MSGYTGWVNEAHDQFKNRLKANENAIRAGVDLNKLNPQQLVNFIFTQKMKTLAPESVKFRMPPDAKLFQFKEGETIQSSLTSLVGDEIHLPFPVIALEFYSNLGDDQIPTIIFAVEQEDDIAIEFGIKSEGKWQFIEDVIFYLNRQHYGVRAGRFGEQKEHDPQRVELIEWCGKTAYIAVAQLICALACSNVNISDHSAKPSALKQQMRKGKNKLPLYSYKTLTVKVGKNDDDAITLDANEDESQDHSGKQTHTKRSHLRRGHPRVYASGHKIWVNSCNVGNKKLGRVEKSYELTI